MSVVDDTHVNVKYLEGIYFSLILLLWVDVVK